MATKEDFSIQEGGKNETIDEKYRMDVKDTDTDADSYYEYPDDGIETQFTWRSAIIGSLLGSVVAASNMYLGLKSGWTFSASIFGAILGFAILKPLSQLSLKYGGSPFGMKENCTAQTAATAAGGLSAGFVAGVPAMFRLNLLPPLEQCWDRFFLWTLAAGFYGLFFAIPLRSYFIIQQKLVFPSPVAAAHTIRTLHSGDGVESRIQTKFIIYSFIGSTLYKIIAYFVPFIVDLHPLYWISTVTNSKVLFDIDVTWRWKFQLTTAFYGAGMMVGLNTALSFFGGNLLAWGILGPILMYNENSDILHDLPYGFSPKGVRVQYWNLWVGIVIMICASFTELFMQYRILWNSIKGGSIQLYNLVARIVPGMEPKQYAGANNRDPVPAEENIPAWMWMIGLLLSFILTIIVCAVYFQMNVGAAILAGILGFIFSFIGCQSTGETDINPTGVIGKASQFCFAGIPAETLALRQTHNLIAGIISSSCASQAVDMVGDLKTGHLLKASPKSQFYSQLVGTVFGIVIAVVLFQLFGTAYPCILKELEAGEKCVFPAPAVNAWAGVTRALTTDISAFVPVSCRIACLVFGLLTIVTVVLKNTLLKPYAKWIPNWNAIGVAFVNPAPYIPLANLVGALIAVVWNKINPRYWQIMGIALASGLIAGEGIGGVFHAIFNVANLKQDVVATGFACPSNDFSEC